MDFSGACPRHACSINYSLTSRPETAKLGMGELAELLPKLSAHIVAHGKILGLLTSSATAS